MTAWACIFCPSDSLDQLLAEQIMKGESRGDFHCTTPAEMTVVFGTGEDVSRHSMAAFSQEGTPESGACSTPKSRMDPTKRMEVEHTDLESLDFPKEIVDIMVHARRSFIIIPDQPFQNVSLTKWQTY